jgi:hypothetical protein
MNSFNCFDHRCVRNIPSISRVYAYGDNTSFQLGVGDCIDRHLPVVVNYVQNKQVKDVALGAYHTLLLTSTCIWHFVTYVYQLMAKFMLGVEIIWVS